VDQDNNQAPSSEESAPSSTTPAPQPEPSEPDSGHPVGQHPGEIGLGLQTRGGDLGVNPAQRGAHPGEIGVQNLLGGEGAARDAENRVDE
jgi:hypothetical protein